MRSWWRAAVFALILAAGGLLTVYFHDVAGLAQGEKIASLSPPLRINIYVADKSATVTAKVTVGEETLSYGRVSKSSPVARLTMTVRPLTTNVLIESTLPDIYDSQSNCNSSVHICAPLFHKAELTHKFTAYVLTSIGADLEAQGRRNAGLAAFQLPRSAYDQPHDGSVSAHLPALGGYEFGPNVSPGLIADNNGVVSLGGSATSADCAKMDRQSTGTCYWIPASFASSDYLLGARLKAETSDWIVDTPIGAVEAASVAWHGSFGLAPVFVTVQRSSEEKGRKYDFFSGIAAASAAAAFIALIQERPGRPAIPRWWKIRRIRRRIREDRRRQSSG